MKTIRFLAALCCMLAVFTACEKNEPNDKKESAVSAPTGSENGHGYVDLGLPSGTKWATCNVGATKLEEYGNYYAWGETEPKTTYDWNTYKWATATYNAEYGSWDLETLTKYNTDSYYGTVDNKTVLELADDAARANWGGQWRMPTDEEWKELLDNCIWTWTFDDNDTDMRGMIVTSKINGNSIFLPAAGYCYSDDLSFAGNFGCYWSSVLLTGENDALSLGFSIYRDDDVYRDYIYDRFEGRSVRPVLGDNTYDNATGTENGHGYVDLRLPSGLKWATCNVGATRPEYFGNYYAWGETEPKTTYNWSTYKWCNGSRTTLTKYNTKSYYGTVDNKTVLELADDAARANWGGAWRMPTNEEWQELLNNCTWTWTTKNGILGYEVKSANGNYIFLPAAGYRNDGDLFHGSSYYWLGSLDADYPSAAWLVDIYPDGVSRYSNYRYYGRSVRAVCE